MNFITGFESPAVRSRLSDESGFRCVGDSLTVQADAKAADMNFIMDRFQKTGQFPGFSSSPAYGDFDNVSDFRTALDLVREAQADFMQLPAKVRARFENDPVQFVEFVEDPGNLEEMDALGLLTKEASSALREQKAKVKEQPTAGFSREGDSVEASGRGSSPPGKPRAKSHDAE